MKKRNGSRITSFFFPDETDHWLSVLRLGLSAQVLSFCWSLRSDWNYLLAGTGAGLFSRQLSEKLLSADTIFVPRLGWLVAGAKTLGLREDFALTLAWALLLVAGYCCSWDSARAWRRSAHGCFTSPR